MNVGGSTPAQLPHYDEGKNRDNGDPGNYENKLGLAEAALGWYLYVKLDILCTIMIYDQSFFHLVY